MAKHAVIRLDAMTGTHVAEALKSVRFYDSNDEPAVIDNAQLVVLGDKYDREVYKATAPTAASTRADLFLTAGVELFYDETHTHYLTEWENGTDRPFRVYKVSQLEGQTFAATAEAFEGEPAKDKYVGFAAGSTKPLIQDAADATTFGKIVYVESTGYGEGAYTFYMIDIIPAQA